MKRDLFVGKPLLITGGTGSFGNKVLDRFLKEDIGIKEIRVFSRDEKKQEDMRIKYKNDKILTKQDKLLLRCRLTRYF